MGSLDLPVTDCGRNGNPSAASFVAEPPTGPEEAPASPLRQGESPRRALLSLRLQEEHLAHLSAAPVEHLGPELSSEPELRHRVQASRLLSVAIAEPSRGSSWVAGTESEGLEPPPTFAILSGHQLGGSHADTATVGREADLTIFHRPGGKFSRCINDFASARGRSFMRKIHSGTHSPRRKSI